MPSFGALVKVFSEPMQLKKDTQENAEAGITAIDYEEQTAGYQAAYSRLAASEVESPDPVAYIREPRQFLSQQLMPLVTSNMQIKTSLTKDSSAKLFLDGLGISVLSI